MNIWNKVNVFHNFGYGLCEKKWITKLQNDFWMFRYLAEIRKQIIGLGIWKVKYV